MRFSSVLILLLLPALSSAAITTRFTVNGADIGQNDFNETADGHFTSKTRISVGTTNISSDLSGLVVKGKLVEFAMHEDTPVGIIDRSLKDNKLTIRSPAGVVNLDYKFSGVVFFTNYHPQLMRTIANGYSADVGGAQKIPIFVMEAGASLNAEVTSLGTRSFKEGSTNATANGYRVSINGLVIDLYTLGNGKLVGENVDTQKFRAVEADATGLFDDPLAKYPELSQPIFTTKTTPGLKVPMRDGVNLVADAVMPEPPGKYPAILVRTPYGREDQMVNGDFFAKRGYVYVVEDCRGRGGSDGDWDPFVNERKDGYDTIQWIAQQPWCDGNVGMIGGSYSGYVQWAAAVEAPPALKCIVPQVSPPDAFENIPYEYGTLPLVSDLWWSNIVRTKKADMGAAARPMKNPKGFATLPLSDVPEQVFGMKIPFFDAWLERDGMDKWAGFDFEKDLTKASVPALNISGWFDGDGIGTALHWEAMRKAGRTNQWLIEGPWIHAFNTTSKLGEEDFGPTAIIDLDSVTLRWFDTWLKGREVGWGKQPKVRYFVMGANEWRSVKDFPEPGSVARSLYLSDGGSLSDRPGHGAVGYVYDPSKAKIGPGFDGNLMRMSGASLNMKVPKDGVAFRSAPMAKDMTLTGPLSVDLYVKIDTPTTDLFAVLVDEFPDGAIRAMEVTGKLNLSYAYGLDRPRLVKPGSVVHAHLKPWDTARRIAKGHRLILIVQSQMFPFFARNLNTGEPILTGTKMRVAHIKILYDKAHPSRVSFYAAP